MPLLLYKLIHLSILNELNLLLADAIFIITGIFQLQ